MQREHNEFKVGLMVSVVLLLFVVILLFIGQWGTLFQRTRELQVRFKDEYGVQGLRVKDPVRVGGVNVGRVRDIQVRPDASGYFYVDVTAEIPKYVELRDDCRITIGTKFVGEGGTLDILWAGSKGKKLTDEDIVNGSALAGFAQLTEQISHQLDAEDPATLMSKIHRIANNLDDLSTALVGELNRDDKKAVLSRVNLALDSLNESIVTAKEMLESAKPKVETTLTHIEATAKRLDEQISVVVAGELDRESADSLLAKIHAAISSAKAGIENFQTMTVSGKELLVINRENLQGVIDNFAETSDHLKATAKELRRNPWRLLYKPDKPDREYANLMDATRNFADAAGRLDQVNNKLTQLLKLDPKGITADDPQFIKIREQVKDAFCSFEQAQEKLWKLLKMQ